MKASIKHYWKPTPIFWRKIGDSLLAVSLTGIPVILADYKWIGIALFILGVIGKFLTNFFKIE
jgi:hypothetical protein